MTQLATMYHVDALNNENPDDGAGERLAGQARPPGKTFVSFFRLHHAMLGLLLRLLPGFSSTLALCQYVACVPCTTLDAMSPGSGSFRRVLARSILDRPW